MASLGVQRDSKNFLVKWKILSIFPLQCNRTHFSIHSNSFSRTLPQMNTAWYFPLIRFVITTATGTGR